MLRFRILHSWRPLIKINKASLLKQISHGNYFIVHSTLRFELNIFFLSFSVSLVQFAFLVLFRVQFSFLFHWRCFAFRNFEHDMNAPMHAINVATKNLLDRRFNHTHRQKKSMQARARETSRDRLLLLVGFPAKFHRVGHSFRFPLSLLVLHNKSDTGKEIESIHDKIIQPCSVFLRVYYVVVFFCRCRLPVLMLCKRHSFGFAAAAVIVWHSHNVRRDIAVEIKRQPQSKCETLKTPTGETKKIENFERHIHLWDYT